MLRPATAQKNSGHFSVTPCPALARLRQTHDHRSPSGSEQVPGGAEGRDEQREIAKVAHDATDPPALWPSLGVASDVEEATHHPSETEEGGRSRVDGGRGQHHQVHHRQALERILVGALSAVVHLVILGGAGRVERRILDVVLLPRRDDLDRACQT